MVNLPNATSQPLPSPRQLRNATAVALVVGAVIVVTAVLPAEYGVDPSGAGRVLGLTAMGELKHRAEAAAHTPPPLATPAPTPPSEQPARSPLAPSLADPEPEGVVDAGEGLSANEAKQAGRSDELDVTLQPNKGVEVKAMMKAGDEMTYSWATSNQAKVFYDFHGEPKGAAKDVYESFKKGTDSKAEGTFVAPFEGIHGWYWKNKTSEPVTIHVKASGNYASIGRI